MRRAFTAVSSFLLSAVALLAAENPVLLEINVFQGFRPTAPPQEPSASSVVLFPPDPGWSDQIERQRQQIVETLGLDGVTVIGKQRAVTAFGSTHSVQVGGGATPFLRVAVRPTRAGASRVALEIRLTEGKGFQRELASFSLSGELRKTFIVGSKSAAGPLFVAVTPRDAPPITGSSDVQTIGGAVKPPRLLRRIDPNYPEKLRADKKGGLVILQAVINEQGAVTQPAIVRHSDPEFESAALEAVRQWRYEPATLAGKPVRVYLTITVTFQVS